MKKNLLDLGASFVGFSDVRSVLPEKLSTYHNAVTIGVKLLDAVIDEIDGMPTHTYFKHYRTVNALLDEIVLKGCMWLEAQGYRAYPVAASQSIDAYTGVFQHKTAACLAGLGFIGKSALFISHAYGPRVRLATILTDAPLEWLDVEHDKDECISTGNTCRCGDCRKCVEACPAMAISGEMPMYEDGEIVRSRLYDAKACSDYMSMHFKEIGRGSVCGVCVRVCPFGGSGGSKRTIKSPAITAK